MSPSIILRFGSLLFNNFDKEMLLFFENIVLHWSIGRCVHG